MKIAVYSSLQNEACQQTVRYLFEAAQSMNINVSCHETICQSLLNYSLRSFTSYKDLGNDIDMFFSVGGDGTLLRCLELIRDTQIPVIGINTGRLGFLATLQADDIQVALQAFLDQKYTVEKRSLLTVDVQGISDEIAAFPLALNEVGVSRKNTTSMITVHTRINGESLNSYWADGFIVSTPTGSTGYSLSNGGPIIDPNSKSLVLTPIAPHNLNARPLVISEDDVVELSVSSREDANLLSVDSRIHTIPTGHPIRIQKAAFPLQLARLHDDSYFKTLRNILHWGKDQRN